MLPPVPPTEKILAPLLQVDICHTARPVVYAVPDFLQKAHIKAVCFNLNNLQVIKNCNLLRKICTGDQNSAVILVIDMMDTVAALEVGVRGGLTDFRMCVFFHVNLRGLGDWPIYEGSLPRSPWRHHWIDR